MLVVPTWQFLHKRQIPSMDETNLLELSAYYLRALALTIASQWQAQFRSSRFRQHGCCTHTLPELH